MFNNILICSFVPENNEASLDTVFTLAKKFDSNIVLIKCFHKDLPRFMLFHTKSEKRKENELLQETQLELKKVEELAKSYDVFVKTEYVFVESLSEYITSYVHKNHIDLLVADHIPPSDISVQDHKDVVNRIYKNIECSVLTLK